jgi:hypothetical protein
MTARRSDPVDAMLAIGERFMRQAQELDDRTQDAIGADASQGDIIALRNLADVSRLRALSAFQAASPFVRPRLQAIEVAPASESTVSRFERAIEAMSEDEVIDHLKAIANGAKALELIGGPDDEA